MTESEAIAEIARLDLKRIECAVSDFTSIPRGKILDTKLFLARPELRLASFVLGITVTCTEPHRLYTDFVPRSMPDVRFLPDWGTFAVNPIAPVPTGTFLCDASGSFQSPRGETMDCAGLMPRTILRRVLRRLADAGLTARVAPELEFALVTVTDDGQAQTLRPAPGCAGAIPHQEPSAESLSLEAAHAQAPFFDALWAACEHLCIPITGYAHEASAGQYEVNFAPAEPLAQADAVFRFKNLARELGRRHGMIATFLAKPYPDDTGSGMHWHLSLKDKSGANPFADRDGRPSDAMRHFIGGWQKAVRGGAAIYAPFANSYFRFVAPDASPASADWSGDNRAVAFRIPDSDAANLRLENRLPGADANPYLTLAVMLGTGLEGMRQGLAPTAPIAGVPGKGAGPQLPRSVSEALDAFEACPILAAVFGRQFIDLFSMVKRFEVTEQNEPSFTIRNLLTRA
ncbi:MAG TPA: glutamine synthetase family protein [Kiloniellales bacterium]